MDPYAARNPRARGHEPADPVRPLDPVRLEARPHAGAGLVSDAAVLLRLAEHWARLTARHAPAARVVPELHAALTRLAAADPAAAARCPALLELLGPSVVTG